MKLSISPFTAALLLASAGALTAQPVLSAENAANTYTLTIKDHRFEPAQLDVPAGKKLTLLVKNLDASPEEFESHDLKREKIIPGKSQASIAIGPLKPGTYKFFGEYHESTAKGQIVAK